MQLEETAQALAVKRLLAIWQVHGGKNRPWTGLALMACLPCGLNGVRANLVALMA